MIYGQKSVETISAMLACLYVGHVYIPVQEPQPLKRLKLLCKNSNAQLCLYDIKIDCEFLLMSDTLLLHDLKVETTRTKKYSREKFLDMNLDAHVFTLYTSGSTGQPKGVKFSQRNVLHFLNWAIHTFRLQPKDRVASFAPIHFDLSTFDIFATLIAGATIYLIPEEHKLFPSVLAGYLQKQHITVIYMVPTALMGLVNQGNWQQSYASSLRLILFAGEPFPIHDLKQLRSLYPQARMANLYGPTETNVCTWYEVPELTELHAFTTIPIGRAVCGLNIYIVDKEGRVLTMPGSIGELYCVGPAVSLGYVTSDDNFFGVIPERGYKSGDMVQLTEHGYIFLHRKDNQIKHRGFRIDPSEIESCLRRHAMIYEVAVISQNNILIAFLSKASFNLNETQLKHELYKLCKDYLPLWMHPTRFCFVDKLPRTPSGKVNYPALSS